MTHDLCHFHFLSFSDKAIKEKLSLSLFFQRKHISFVLLSLSVYFQIKLQRKDMDEPLTKDLTVALSLDICANHSLTVREESLLSWKILSRTHQDLSKRNDEKNIRERCWEKNDCVHHHHRCHSNTLQHQLLTAIFIVIVIHSHSHFNYHIYMI